MIKKCPFKAQGAKIKVGAIRALIMTNIVLMDGWIDKTENLMEIKFGVFHYDAPPPPYLGHS